jgi:hypothetical protein
MKEILFSRLLYNCHIVDEVTVKTNPLNHNLIFFLKKKKKKKKE